MSVLLVVASIVVARRPHVHAQVRGRYTGDTINLSYPMLQYMHRSLRRSGAVERVAIRFPGAPLLHRFLEDNIGRGTTDSVAYFGIAFKKGSERAVYKKANDYGPGLERQEGWTPANVLSVAELCEAFLDRQVSLARDSEAMQALSDPHADVGRAWNAVASAGSDPLVPPELAAALATSFLDRVRRSDQRLKTLAPGTRSEIDQFRKDFGEGKLKRALKFDDGVLLPRVGNEGLLRAFEQRFPWPPRDVP